MECLVNDFRESCTVFYFFCVCKLMREDCSNCDFLFNLLPTNNLYVIFPVYAFGFVIYTTCMSKLR